MNKIAAFSKAKNMVKIDKIEDGSENVWYFLTPKVQTFIAKFEVGQEVEFEIEEKQGKKVISFIKMKGEKTVMPKRDNSTGFTCTECGASLKDGKYKTCYNCSQAKKGGKVSSKEEPVSDFTCTECGAALKDDKYPTCYSCSMKLKAAGNNKTPEVQESIMRQAVGHMVSRTLIGMQGTFDINSVGDIINTLYDTYLKKVSGK